MKALLASLPNAISAEVRQLAKTGGRNKGGMRYCAPSHQAFWLLHHSNRVLTCFTFENVPSLEKAAEIWTELDVAAEMQPQVGEPHPSASDQMREIYSRVVGIPIESVAIVMA
jgi:hypothetical protein